MSLKNGDRFTVYDAMDAAGYFATNPANANARDKDGRGLYKGPVKFPMMLYHPQGELRVSVQGTRERTSWGTVEMFGEQTELISREVRSEEELTEALDEGWHKHPAKAIRAANESWRKERGLPALAVPAISAGSLIADQEAEIRRLTELLEQNRKDKELLEAEGSASGAGGGVFAPPSRGTTRAAGLV